MKPPGQDPMANLRRQQEQQRRMQEQQQQMQKMQQQQLQQMQDHRRRQQMGAAWMAQQKAQQAASAFQSTLDPRFAQVEGQVARLRVELAAGQISFEEARAQLQNLMIQDDQGSLWTVGFETGGWYRYNGQAWEKARPPLTALAAQPTPANTPVTRRKSRPFAGILVLIFGLILTAAAGLAAGYYAGDSFGLYSESIYIAGAMWLLGLILTLRSTARTWRGN